MSTPNRKLTDVAPIVRELAESLGLAPTVARAQRKIVRSRSARVSDDFIERVAAQSRESGGTVAGFPFDPAEARDALAHLFESREAAYVLRALAQQIEDNAHGRRAVVANQAFGAYLALDRMLGTPAGEGLGPLREQLKSLLRATERPNRKRARAAKRAAAQTAPAPGAPEVAPTPSGSE